jgi:glucose/arabinose dehydrogenase
MTRTAVLLALAPLGCTSDPAAPRPLPYEADDVAFEAEVLAEGFVIPFDVAIVDDDTWFVSDRSGRMYRYDGGDLTELSGVPEVSHFTDPGIPAILHGGLMDVELHPDYPATPWLYLAHWREGTLQVSRARVDGDALVDRETVFETRTLGWYGNGTRIVWQDDDHFFLSVGGTTISTQDQAILIAQDLREDWGKVHRLRADGSVPDDNPILPGLEAPTTIWSFGHRDPQGLWLDRASGELLGVEHGPKGGDELNVILPGGNYGWPLFTYGIDYSGEGVSLLSEAEAAAVTELPEHHWTVDVDGGSSIAPAFLLGVQDSAFDGWNGRYLLNSLSFRWLLVFDRDTQTTRTIDVTGGLRGAAQLPSGDLLVLRERTSPDAEDGQVIRLSPQ